MKDFLSLVVRLDDRPEIFVGRRRTLRHQTKKTLVGVNFVEQIGFVVEVMIAVGQAGGSVRFGDFLLAVSRRLRTTTFRIAALFDEIVSQTADRPGNPTKPKFL